MAVRRLGRRRTVLLCIDWQVDFCGPGGYECPILAEGTGATDPANHESAVHMVTMQGGVFGCVADSTDVIAATSTREDQS